LKRDARLVFQFCPPLCLIESLAKNQAEITIKINHVIESSPL